MRRALALMVCALSLGGCAGQTQVRYPEVSSSPTTTITLINAGAQPRRVLSIEPTLDTTQRVRITTRQRGQNLLGGQPGVDTGNIATRVDLNVKATGRQDDGTTQLEYFYDTAGADPDVEMNQEIVDNIATSNEPLVGQTMNVTLARNGTVRQASFGSLDGVSDVNAQYLQQIADQVTTYQSALPDEAVGVGGSWSTSVALTINKISVTTNTTYTIQTMTDSNVTVAISVTQTPNGKTFNVDSQAVEVIEWDVAGQGSMVIEFDRPLPVAYDLRLTGQQTLRFGGLLDADIVNTISSEQSIVQLD